MAQNDFQMKCGGCCDQPGLCIYDVCCPCLTVMEGANNIGDGCAVGYCLASVCGFGCCALALLGNEVAEKRNVRMDMGTSCVFSFFNMCLCYSCRVVHESRLYKANPNEQQVAGGVANQVVKTTVTTTTNTPEPSPRKADAPMAQQMSEREA